MATFYNQATLSFRGNLTGSNVVSGEIINAVEVTKTAVTQSYGEGESIAYTVSIANAQHFTFTADHQHIGTQNLPHYLTDIIKYYFTGIIIM